MPDLRIRRAIATVVAAAALPGCAAMPTGGGVHLGRALPPAQGLGDLDVRVLPPSWHPGLGPQEVVNGYLRALVNDDDDYAIARSFLTPAASATWRANAGITTYDESGLRETEPSDGSAPRVSVQLRAPRVGHVDDRGDYTPADGTLTATFALARQGSAGWRIDRLPNGVLLSASDAQRSFRAADVYYFNRARTRLVPEQILLQSSQRGVATALVAALVSGPSDWLAPAVRTGVPRGTSLIGNVPVHDDGVADVNLTASVRLASPSDLAALSAQMVWTLRQVSDVRAVRLLAEGAPLPVPDVPSRTPVTAWAKYDPAAPPSSRDVLYVHGRLEATGGDVVALRRSDPGGVVSVARSRDGETLAVVQRAGVRMRLLTGPLGSRLRVRATASAFTPPTFDASGDVVSAASTRTGLHVITVAASGPPRRLDLDAAVAASGIRDLRVSRDGGRVAVVTSAGRLLVGRVAGSPGAEELQAFREVAPGLRDVRGVVWTDADMLAVTAAGTSGGARQVVVLDSEGYSSRSISVEGLRGNAVDVAGAPGEPLLVATTTGVIWADLEGWRPIATGTAPVHSG